MINLKKRISYTRKCVLCKRVFTTLIKIHYGKKQARETCNVTCERLLRIKTKEITLLKAWSKNGGMSYEGLHLWVHKNKKKTSCCQRCHKKKPLDAANISQKYKRDIRDWEWLCRKCHLTKDGRLKRLIEGNKFFHKSWFKKGHKMSKETIEKLKIKNRSRIHTRDIITGRFIKSKSCGKER